MHVYLYILLAFTHIQNYIIIMENQILLKAWLAHFKSKLNDFTQTSLARKSGISQQHMSDIVLGKRGIGDVTISKLCKGMGISKAEFHMGPSGMREETAEPEEQTCTELATFILGSHDKHDILAEINRVGFELNIEDLEEAFILLYNKLETKQANQANNVKKGA